MLFPSSSLPGSDPRWVYDDPSGVDETPRPDRRPARHGHRDAIRARRSSIVGMVS